MARKNPAREQVLAEVKARRRAAGQKVSRLRGKDVNPSTIDPRMSNAQLAGLNTRQLRSHLNQLNSFISRRNSVVAGLNGTPLNGSTWRQYKRVENIYNNKSTAFYDSVKDLTIPTLNQTVSQYVGGLRESHRAGDYRTFGRLVRNAANITNEKSLQTLLKQMQKRADPDYLKREAQLQRRILRKMLERTSNKNLIPIIRDMSDENIITLAQYTEFVPTLEGSYAMAKSISTDTPRWQSSVYEDNEETIQALVDWAHQHFSDENTSEQDADDARSSTPTRDRYGRFVKKGADNPEPKFTRDEHGRFAKRNP